MQWPFIGSSLLKENVALGKRQCRWGRERKRGPLFGLNLSGFLFYYFIKSLKWLVFEAVWFTVRRQCPIGISWGIPLKRGPIVLWQLLISSYAELSLIAIIERRKVEIEGKNSSRSMNDTRMKYTTDSDPIYTTKYKSHLTYIQLPTWHKPCNNLTASSVLSTKWGRRLHDNVYTRLNHIQIIHQTPPFY